MSSEKEKSVKQRLACLCCGVKLNPVHPGSEFQPNDGVKCTSRGNWGSSVFDAFDRDEELMFFVCDMCLRARMNLVYLIRRESQILSAAEELYECVEMKEGENRFIAKQ